MSGHTFLLLQFCGFLNSAQLPTSQNHHHGLLLSWNRVGKWGVRGEWWRQFKVDTHSAHTPSLRFGIHQYGHNRVIGQTEIPQSVNSI